MASRQVSESLHPSENHPSPRRSLRDIMIQATGYGAFLGPQVAFLMRGIHNPDLAFLGDHAATERFFDKAKQSRATMLRGMRNVPEQEFSRPVFVPGKGLDMVTVCALQWDELRFKIQTEDEHDIRNTLDPFRPIKMLVLCADLEELAKAEIRKRKPMVTVHGPHISVASEPRVRLQPRIRLLRRNLS